MGAIATQLVRAAGGIAIVVVSSEEKAAYCMENGAHGTINRRDYKHWGPSMTCKMACSTMTG